MKSTMITTGLLLAGLCATSAMAQSPCNAEICGPGYTPPVARRATAEEKAQAKQQRREEGRQAALDSMPGEGDPIPEAMRKVAREERQQARAARKEESRRANKAGEITSRGERSY